MHFDIFFVGRIPMFYCIRTYCTLVIYTHALFYGPLTSLIYYCSVKLRRFRKSRCPRLHKYNAIIAIDWSHKSEKNRGLIVKERNESAWYIIKKKCFLKKLYGSINSILKHKTYRYDPSSNSISLFRLKLLYKEDPCS